MKNSELKDLLERASVSAALAREMVAETEQLLKESRVQVQQLARSRKTLGDTLDGKECSIWPSLALETDRFGNARFHEQYQR